MTKTCNGAVRQSSGTRRDQARQLVRDLETRGNRAFPLFLESLRESGQQGLMETVLNRAPPVQFQPAAPIAVRPVVLPLPIRKLDTSSIHRDFFFFFFYTENSLIFLSILSFPASPMDVNKQSKYIVPICPVERANKSSSPSKRSKSLYTFFNKCK